MVEFFMLLLKKGLRIFRADITTIALAGWLVGWWLRCYKLERTNGMIDE